VLRALLTGNGVPEGQVELLYGVIDKIERAPKFEELLSETLVKHGLPGTLAAPISGVARIRGRSGLEGALSKARVSPEAASGLFECLDALDAMGLGEFVDVDTSIVRGLAYYTGIVFELFDAGKSLRAVCGGGRYDGLLKALGGVDLPAVGFGMGDVVLGELLKSRAVAPQASGRLDAFLVAVSGEDMPEVLRLAHELRDLGLAVEFALKEQAVAKQLKVAASRPARRAVLLGPEERKVGRAVVRDLGSGTEERVALASLAQALSKE
jgi:histidyl-tRNA synthetase